MKSEAHGVGEWTVGRGGVSLKGGLQVKGKKLTKPPPPTFLMLYKLYNFMHNIYDKHNYYFMVLLAHFSGRQDISWYDTTTTSDFATKMTE